MADYLNRLEYLKTRHPLIYSPKTIVEKDIAFSSEDLVLLNHYQRNIDQDSNDIENNDLFTDIVSKLDARIKDENIKVINSKYTLPYATSDTLGGVKIGSNITHDVGTINITKDNVITALGYTPFSSNTTYDTFTKSGKDSSSGIVPAPSKIEGSSKFLREDGLWEKTDGEVYGVFGKSGENASVGLVPAPDLVEGHTKYLREDAQWIPIEDSDTKVMNIKNDKTKAYITGTTVDVTNTGEQIFDENIYIDKTEGRLHVKSLEIAPGIILY